MILIAPPAARADEPDQAAAEAKILYEEGVSAARSARWAEAVRAFREAFQRKPHYQIAINLGQAELRSGSYRDAADHLSYFLRSTQGISGPDQDIARSFLAEARAQIGAIHIEASEPGAEIWIDGQRAGKAPLGEDVFVDPGDRRVEARLPGYLPAVWARRINPGEAVDLRLSLVKVQEAPPAAPTPASRKIRNGLVIGGSVAGGALALAGAALATASAVKASQRDHAATGQLAGSQGVHARDRLEEQRAALANASFFTFIAAGAVGAGTLVYALVTPSRAPKRPLPVQAAVGPHGGAVAIDLRF